MQGEERGDIEEKQCLFFFRKMLHEYEAFPAVKSNLPDAPMSTNHEVCRRDGSSVQEWKFVHL